MNVAPCRGCTERKLKCHADCKAYIRWTKEKEAEKQKQHIYNEKFMHDVHSTLARQAIK